MGVRAEKKQKIYNNIVEAAKTVFSKQDFDVTTMEQIATEAGVGLGTAYNYFKSKEELYLLSMAENIASEPFDIDPNQIDKDEVSEVVAEAIIKQIKKMNYVNKKVWKTVLPFLMNGLKADSKFVKNVFKADFQFIDKINDLFNELIKEDKLPIDYPVELVVDMIFGHLLYVFMSYVYFDDYSFEEACDKVRNGIQFITKQ